jgi:amino-acid N-acetyltransferase
MTAIELALDSDRAAIEGLLIGADLPLDGLEVALPNAVVARADGGVVGCAAVEAYGSVGLLRSVCVAPELRGSVLGRRLVAAAEELAASRGIVELYLLTETAEGWFPRLGYVATSRAAVPAALTASPEFTTACPDSAAVLRKRL